MTPPRVRRTRAAKVAGALGPRDWAVLEDLARVRLLTTAQVRRLHVHEGSALTEARRSRALLQRLHDLAVIHRLGRRVGGLRAGSQGFTYGLSTLGQRLTSDRGPAGGIRKRKPWEPSSVFVDHVLAVSELYVRLREVEVDTGREDRAVKLDIFDAEPACWRWWVGAAGERLVLKPDAFVSVLTSEFEYRTFVEVDRATESLPVVRRKAEVYVDYWRSGTEQAEEGLFPRVLFVVPTTKRLEAVVSVLSRLDPETWQLFQVVSEAQAAAAMTGRLPPATGEAEQ